jgi:hypothetical protein
VVFQYVGQYGDIRPECFDIIQLKTADLCDIQGFGLIATCLAKEVTNISNHSAIHTSSKADVMSERSSGCFSIAAGHADNSAIAFEAICQLYFTDDRNSSCPDFCYEFALFGNTMDF